MRRKRDQRSQQIFWGLLLLAFGGLLFAANLGYPWWREFFHYWPFLLIAMGLAKMLFGSDREGGIWIMLGGIYGWICVWNLFGLDWSTAWPLFIIGAGASILVQSLDGRGRKGETDHVG